MRYDESFHHLGQDGGEIGVKESVDEIAFNILIDNKYHLERNSFKLILVFVHPLKNLDREASLEAPRPLILKESFVL